jgi:hypothetical protein
VTRGFGAPPGPRGPRGYKGDQGAFEGANVADYYPRGDGVSDDTAALQAAFSAGRDHVLVPAGTYLITSLTASRATQRITFAPGATLKLGATGGVTFSGVDQRIEGLACLLATASEATRDAVTVSGAGTRVFDPSFRVTADVPNTTLLKVQGARCRVRDFKLVGDGKAFKYAVHPVAAGGGTVDSVKVSGLNIDVGDDGVACTYGALVYLRGLRCEVADLEFDGGGRSLFPDGVVIIDGGKNTLRRPKVFASAATYGLHLKAGSEYLEIYGGHIQGRNNSTYQADSFGLYCAGNFAGGHLKMVQTSITGWNNGWILKGGADTPSCYGVTIANNNEYGIVIDTADTGGLFVSAMTFSGCYIGDVTQLRCMHFKSGNAAGVKFDNCQLGISDGETGFVVDPAFASLTGVVFDGGRILGASGGSSEYVFAPSANTGAILFNNPALHSIAGYGTGDYASKCVDILNPTLAGLVLGTKDAAGTSNNRMTRLFTDIYTANFGTVNAGATTTLTFAYSGVPSINTCTLDASFSSTLGAKASAGIVFQWWLNGVNEIAGSATNVTGSPIASVTGGVRFVVTVFG